MRDRSLWTWHLVAGLVILVFLGLHMVIMHLDATLHVGNPNPGAAVDWANVAARMKSMFFAITYVVLLGAALFHGLYGFRNVLLELNPGGAVRRVVDVGFTLAGVALFVFGAWVALAAPGVAMRMGG